MLKQPAYHGCASVSRILVSDGVTAMIYIYTRILSNRNVKISGRQLSESRILSRSTVKPGRVARVPGTLDNSEWKVLGDTIIFRGLADFGR